MGMLLIMGNAGFVSLTVVFLLGCLVFRALLA